MRDNMDTQIITNPSDQELDMLARALRNGELVSIPTETVYGLGANGLDPEAGHILAWSIDNHIA